MADQDDFHQVPGLPPGLPPESRPDTQTDRASSVRAIPSATGEKTDAHPETSVMQDTTTLLKQGVDDRINEPEACVPHIEGYRIERKLGQGGMGAVYLATDLSLGRLVAIKVVPQSLGNRQEMRDRFGTEIQALAGLQHPNIAQLYSAGTYQDLPYFVMEFVDGPTLDQYAQEPVTGKEAAEIVSQLCEAVAYCHDHDILHRDLKASNVLMHPDGRAKIADFGLAKVIGADASTTRTGEILGTPGYMAPEQASGVVKSLTPACDLYALGAILYRLLTGRPPFVASEPFLVVMQVLSQEPIPPKKLAGDVHRDLETICLKCLQKKPERRYASAKALQEDLSRFLAGRPILARPVGNLEKAAKWVKRNPVKSVLAFGIVLLLAAMLTGLSWHNQRLANELAKTKRLANHGSQLSKWLIEDHLEQLGTLSGTTQARLAVADHVLQFLDATYEDMPSEARTTRQLGVSYTRLAGIKGGSDPNSLGQPEQALPLYLRSLELYDQAEQQNPDDPVPSRLRAVNLIELSEIYSQLNQFEKRDKYFALAEAEVAKLKKGQWKSDLVRIIFLKMKASRAMSQNDFQPALHTLLEAQSMLDELKKIGQASEEDIDHQQITIEIQKGDCYEALGKLGDAETAYQTAMNLALKSSENAPQDVLRQRVSATTLERYANILLKQKKATQALHHYKHARDILVALRKRDPESVELAMSVGTAYSLISNVYSYLQDDDAAGEAIDEALAICQELDDRKVGGSFLKKNLAISTLSKANSLSTRGESALAQKWFDRHEALCQEMLVTDPNSIIALEQMGENRFYRTVLLVTQWTNTPFDGATARESDAYKKIMTTLDEGTAFFDRIEAIKGLSDSQKTIRSQLDKMRQVIEEMIDKLIEAEKSIEDATNDLSSLDVILPHPARHTPALANRPPVV